MDRLARSTILLVMLFVIGIACACSHQAIPLPTPSISESNATTAMVVVTRNFGTEVILAKEIEVGDGPSAMEALKRVADVKTAYGEGFVVDINGVKSGHTEGESADWFFYVNGILANTGALGYNLRGGDIEQWDFHDWSFHAFIPAIIGHFPEPFRHGYRGNICPTIVVYDEGLGETAQALADRLKGLGVKDVFVQNVKGLSQESKKQSNIILLGTANHELISELNRIYG